MRPPDPGRGAGPDGTGPDAQIAGWADRQQDPTPPVRQLRVILARHAWAACAIRSMGRGRCPRCCWCDGLCGCPESAWQVVA
jgi:hypothetical protein